MYTLPSQRKPVGAVLLDSLKLYKSVFLKLLPFSILYAIFLNVSNLVFIFRNHHITLPQYLSSIFVINLINLWLFMVLLFLGYQEMTGLKKDYSRACLIALRKYPVALITSPIYLFLISIGIVLFFLPGIFIAFLLGLYLTAIVIDNMDVIESLQYSAKLTWHHWWRTFIILIIPLLLSMLASITIEVLFETPTMFLHKLAPQTLALDTFIVAIILTIVFLPWFVTTTLCLYHDLKLRRQANCQE